VYCTTRFASAFYDESSNLTHQSLRICPFQYEKRAGGCNTDPGAVERTTHTTNAADTDESFELTNSAERDTETELLDTQVRGVHVLEAIEQSDELRDRPVQVLCPNCGEAVGEEARATVQEGKEDAREHREAAQDTEKAVVYQRLADKIDADPAIVKAALNQDQSPPS